MSSSLTITDDLSTPGQILREEFLEPLAVSQYRLAKRIGVDQTRISRIIRGDQSITVDTALRLATFFGTSAQFWLRLQENYDLAIARARLDLSGIQPLPA